MGIIAFIVLGRRGIGGGGGVGVSVYMRDTVKYRIIPSHSLSHQYMECLFIEIDGTSGKRIVGVVYRPPNAVHDIFVEELPRLCSFFPSGSYQLFILCGDMNNNMLNYDSDIYVCNFEFSIFNSGNNQTY